MSALTPVPTDDDPVLVACSGPELARLGVRVAARICAGRPVVVAVIWTPAAHFRPADARGNHHGIAAPATVAQRGATMRRPAEVLA